ncbi:MAG: GYD domain-containing protein [Chloroflexi bacterium]|nr:GYD domain-containing protein [Chloroflexota bacterium]
MAGYIVLGKYTREGIERIKDMPEIIKKHRAKLEGTGIRLIGTWCTLGQYDFVSIYDAPDDLAMAERVIETVQNGLVTTQTMRALSEEEFAQVVSKLP